MGFGPVGEEEAGQGALELGAGAGPGPDLEARCPGVVKGETRRASCCSLLKNRGSISR